MEMTRVNKMTVDGKEYTLKFIGNALHKYVVKKIRNNEPFGFTDLLSGDTVVINVNLVKEFKFTVTYIYSGLITKKEIIDHNEIYVEEVDKKEQPISEVEVDKSILNKEDDFAEWKKAFDDESLRIKNHILEVQNKIDKDMKELNDRFNKNSTKDTSDINKEEFNF